MLSIKKQALSFKMKKSLKNTRLYPSVFTNQVKMESITVTNVIGQEQKKHFTDTKMNTGIGANTNVTLVKRFSRDKTYLMIISKSNILVKFHICVTNVNTDVKVLGC